MKKVLEFIRKKVKRPKDLPTLMGSLCFPRSKGLCCPLGLVRGAKPYPGVVEQVPGLAKAGITQEEMDDFFRKWDTLKDAKKAVDWVWGKV